MGVVSAVSLRSSLNARLCRGLPRGVLFLKTFFIHTNELVDFTTVVQAERLSIFLANVCVKSWVNMGSAGAGWQGFFICLRRFPHISKVSRKTGLALAGLLDNAPRCVHYINSPLA